MVIFKLMNPPLHSFLFLKISLMSQMMMMVMDRYFVWSRGKRETDGGEHEKTSGENLSGYIFEWWTFGCGIMIHTRSSSPTLVMTFFIHFLLHLIFISSQTFSLLSFSPFLSKRLLILLTILANHQPTIDPSDFQTSFNCVMVFSKLQKTSHSSQSKNILETLPLIHLIDPNFLDFA